MKKQYLTKVNAKVVIAKPRMKIKLGGYKMKKGAGY